MKCHLFFKRRSSYVVNHLQWALAPNKQRLQQGGKIKNDAANHVRSESYETSITYLSINESLSADGSVYIEESEKSNEELSPHHMIQYGKSVLEIETGERATGAKQHKLQETKSDVENSLEEGLSCIIEESSRETQSLDSGPAGGLSFREASANPSPKSATLSSSTQHDDNELLATKKRFSQINTMPPRMIQMDGSILSYGGGTTWRDFDNTSFSRRKFMKKTRVATTNSFSFSREEEDDPASIFAIVNSSPTTAEDEPHPTKKPHSEGGTGLVNLLDREESSSSISRDESTERKGLSKPTAQKKTHRRSSRSFRSFFSRTATRRLTPARDGYAPVYVCDILASALSETANECAGKDLDQRFEITLWTAPDGTTTRFEV